MKASIKVTLKNGILDPQGRAVQHALETINGASVKRVRIGKLIEIEIGEDDPEKAREALRRMCDKLLANPVTEDYQIDILDE